MDSLLSGSRARVTRHNWLIVMCATSALLVGVVAGVVLISLLTKETHYRELADRYSLWESRGRQDIQASVASIDSYEKVVRSRHLDPKEASQAELMLASMRRGHEALCKLVEYEASMKQKYLRAAQSPWVPVEPDPPRPSIYDLPLPRVPE